MILIGRLFHLCFIPTWRLFCFHTQVLTIPFWTVCSVFGVENIYANQKQKLVKENVLVNTPTGCEKSHISNKFTRAELANLIETRRVNYFSTDSTAIGSSCIASEAYHSRSVLCGWQYRQKSKRSRFVSTQIHVIAKIPCTQEDSSGLLWMKHTAFHTGKYPEIGWIERAITMSGADCCLKNQIAKSQHPLMWN